MSNDLRKSKICKYPTTMRLTKFSIFDQIYGKLPKKKMSLNFTFPKNPNY